MDGAPIYGRPPRRVPTPEHRTSDDAGEGFGPERGADGHAAGLRTTRLVVLTAVFARAHRASPVDQREGAGRISTMDFMRMPPGILTGVGFVAADAILERGKLVLWAITAAAL